MWITCKERGGLKPERTWCLLNVSSACLLGEDPLPTEDRLRQTRTGPDVRAPVPPGLKKKHVAV